MQQLQKPRQGYKYEKFLFGKYEEIPFDWEIVKLIDLCKSKPQYGAALAAIPMSSSLPRYIRITDLHDDGSLKNERVCIREEDARPFILSEGEILFARTGSIGRTYIYKNEDGKCAFAGYLIRFTPDEKKLDVKFLFHYTHSDNYWRWLNSIFTQGVLPNINAEQYSNMLIPKPPLLEQQKIEMILSKVDELIQKTDHVIEQTQRLKKGLMQRLLTKGIGHTEFKTSKLGPIPYEWEVAKLGDIARVSTGNTPPTLVKKYYSGTIPFIRTAEIRNEVIRKAVVHISREAVHQCSLEVYPPRTVLLAMYGQGKTRGQSALLDISAATSQNAAAIVPSADKLDPIYLWHYLLYVYDKLRVMGNIGHISHLNLNFVKELSLPLPVLEEQKKIAFIFSQLDSKIEKEFSAKNKIEWFKKGLMQKLLTGKIRVKV
jgi:type I restriction enzyme S subunit